LFHHLVKPFESRTSPRRPLKIRGLPTHPNGFYEKREKEFDEEEGLKRVVGQGRRGAGDDEIFLQRPLSDP